MIIPFKNIYPKIPASCFVAPQSIVIGNVEIGEESSLWFQTVVRGDVHSIRIGRRTNIQDFCMIHVTTEEGPHASPTLIGDEVTVGHRVILHGCTIEDRALIGMGSIILDGAVIGMESVVGAGSLVTQDTRIPEGHLAFGSPARVIRPLKDHERNFLAVSAEHYYQLSRKYLNP